MSKLHLFFRIFIILPFSIFFSAILTSCSTATIGNTSHTENARFIPEGYSIPTAQKIISENDDILCSVYSKQFAQGDSAYAEIYVKREGVSDLSIRYNTAQIPLSKRIWGYRTIFAIPPESKPGSAKLTIRYNYNGTQNEKEIPLNIVDGNFKVFRQALNLGVFSNDGAALSTETLKFIEECDKKKKSAFSEKIPDQLDSALSHPRNMHYITSDFYSKRVYMRYIHKKNKKVMLKDKERIHYGLDLRGEQGSPVYAIAAGKVALADPLYYEGNLVIINHGDGIFSYYMHQYKLLVKQGDMVKAGQQIGEVGNTGASTGPHLHISLKIRDVMADPLSILSLPIRD